MSTATSDKTSAAPVIEDGHPAVKEKIAQQVLKSLGGKPKNFFRIDVHHLWANRYRVNIWSEVETKPVATNGSSRGGFWMTGDSSIIKQRLITHSYFIHRTSEGLVSSPKIESEKNGN